MSSTPRPVTRASFRKVGGTSNILVTLPPPFPGAEPTRMLVYAPYGGGYVSADGRALCAKLAHNGPVLHCSPQFGETMQDALLRVCKREWRRANSK